MPDQPSPNPNDQTLLSLVDFSHITSTSTTAELCAWQQRLLHAERFQSRTGILLALSHGAVWGADFSRYGIKPLYRDPILALEAFCESAMEQVAQGQLSLNPAHIWLEQIYTRPESNARNYFEEFQKSSYFEEHIFNHIHETQFFCQLMLQRQFYDLASRVQESFPITIHVFKEKFALLLQAALEQKPLAELSRMLKYSEARVTNQQFTALVQRIYDEYRAEEDLSVIPAAKQKCVGLPSTLEWAADPEEEKTQKFVKVLADLGINVRYIQRQFAQDLLMKAIGTRSSAGILFALNQGAQLRATTELGMSVLEFAQFFGMEGACQAAERKYKEKDKPPALVIFLQSVVNNAVSPESTQQFFEAMRLFEVRFYKKELRQDFIFSICWMLKAGHQEVWAKLFLEAEPEYENTLQLILQGVVKQAVKDEDKVLLQYLQENFYDTFFKVLRSALEQEKVSKLLILLGDNPKQNVANNKTALYAAAGMNKPKVIIALLDKGLDPHEKSDCTGESVFVMFLKHIENRMVWFYPIEEIAIKAVEKFIAKGADLTTVQNEKKRASLLHTLSCLNKSNIVQQFLCDQERQGKVYGLDAAFGDIESEEEGEVINIGTSQSDEQEVLDRLTQIAQLTSEPYQQQFETQKQERTDLLCQYILLGQVEKVRVFLKIGLPLIDINQKNSNGITPFECAMNINDSIILALLRAIPGIMLPNAIPTYASRMHMYRELQVADQKYSPPSPTTLSTRLLDAKYPDSETQASRRPRNSFGHSG